MPMLDPQSADLSKVTASLVRDARSVLRRADKLASAVTAADDTTTTQSAAAAPEVVAIGSPVSRPERCGSGLASTATASASGAGSRRRSCRRLTKRTRPRSQ